MARYLGKRLALSVVTVLLASMLLFLAAQILPGDVARSILGPYASPEQIARLNHELGTDRPLVVRYVEWLSGMLRGDWGTSALLDVPVRPLVLDRLKNSALLGGFALLIMIPLAVGLGVLAGLRHRRPVDRAISIGGMSLIAVPDFVTGILLIVVFAIDLRWFPASSSPPSLADPIDVVRQLLLPAIPVVCAHFGYVSRMTRQGVVDVNAANYVRTAWLKGLSPGRIVRRHVLRNALVPTVTVLAIQTGYILGGLAVIETLFDYPGLGKLIVDSATNHDLPTLQSSVFLVMVIFMTLNFVADTVTGLLNPRIRPGAE